MASKTLSIRIVTTIAIALIVALLTWLLWPYLSIFTDRDELNRVIGESGIFGPLIFMGLQAIQVIIAPIPATVVTLAGGYVFGTFWSTVYSMIGSTLGFWAVFIIVVLVLASYYREAIYKYIDRFHAWMLGKSTAKRNSCYALGVASSAFPQTPRLFATKCFVDCTGRLVDVGIPCMASCHPFG